MEGSAASHLPLASRDDRLGIGPEAAVNECLAAAFCDQFHDLFPPLLSPCPAGRLSECEAQLAAVQQQAERVEAAAEGLPTAELERQVCRALHAVLMLRWGSWLTIEMLHCQIPGNPASASGSLLPLQ